MKTLLTTTAVILVMATTATAGPKSCPVRTDTSGVQIIKKGCAAFVGASGTDGIDGADGATGATGATGEQGARGEQGLSGNDGLDGLQGLTGAAGTSGQDGATGAIGQTGATGETGAQGTKGDKGDTGDAAVAPLGSLSFASASAAFSGDGMGFGLSDSNYGDLEGSVVVGFGLGNDWRAVAGITTDFNGKVAGSIGVGVSF